MLSCLLLLKGWFHQQGAQWTSQSLPENVLRREMFLFFIYKEKKCEFICNLWRLKPPKLDKWKEVLPCYKDWRYFVSIVKEYFEIDNISETLFWKKKSYQQHRELYDLVRWVTSYIQSPLLIPRRGRGQLLCQWVKAESNTLTSTADSRSENFNKKSVFIFSLMVLCVDAGHHGKSAWVVGLCVMIHRVWKHKHTECAWVTELTLGQSSEQPWHTVKLRLHNMD